MQTLQTDENYTVSVTLRHNARPQEFRCNHLQLNVGDKCIVDTDHGPSLATVSRARMKLAGRGGCCQNRMRNVIRKATPKDIADDEERERKEKDIFRLAKAKVLENELKMKISYVEVTFDKKRALVYFTAEGRVDFRNMAKSLASELNIKIEMRQMGIRDEAKTLGGCGICGNKLCCSSFLSDFAPVSIRMAKDQNLSLNPAKISGVCGRLMCCLVYENDFYKEMQKTVPRSGKAVNTPKGRGKVIYADYLKGKVTVDLGDGGLNVFDAAEVTLVNPPQQQKQKSKKGGREEGARKEKDGDAAVNTGNTEEKN